MGLALNLAVGIVSPRPRNTPVEHAELDPICSGNEVLFSEQLPAVKYRNPAKFADKPEKTS